MGAFAEMEAELIRERVISGLVAAKENGKTLGRPELTKQKKKALHLSNTTELSTKDIAKECQLSLSTVYNLISKKKMVN
ncbi:hypothetical protein IV74_GL000665 [Carnobacterium divergens DSM 20623]|uniref:Resolvase/invertase-type recombinase catalytic domain-containing protein n=2 Tax=Carnobacterium divergens TaxID=2748 RepID=A0A0R2I553_CARDV|nr:hypothetical protein IV74_GL000665 [Carnobacterium divergens DSM 20623]